MINHMLANDEDIERLLFIMANLPEFLRLSLARRKVKELISMAETERLESISRAFSCTSLIEPNKMVELLGSLDQSNVRGRIKCSNTAHGNVL